MNDEDIRQSEIEMLRAAEKPVIMYVVGAMLIFALATFGTDIGVNRPFFFIVSGCTLTLTLLFQLLVVPSRYYGKLLSTVENMGFSLIAILILYETGGLSSPFYPFLFLMVVSAPPTRVFGLPASLVCALFQTMILLPFTLFAPIELGFRTEPVIFSIIYIVMPMLVGTYMWDIVSALLKERVNRLRIGEQARVTETGKRRLELIINEMNDAVVILSESGHVELFNPVAEEVFQVEMQNMIGELFEQHVVLLDPKQEPIMSRIVSSDEAEVFANVLYQLPSGKRLIFRVRSLPWIDQDAKRRGTILLIRNMTKSSGTDKVKLDLISMAAHEIRTPLTSIKGYASLLLIHYGQKLNDDERKYLARVDEAADQLKGIMDNILAVARLERGKVKLSKNPIDWIRFMEEMVERQQAAAVKKGLKLYIAAEQEAIPQVEADELRLSEVLGNLINNAIKYTQKGEVVVRSYLSDNQLYVITEVQDSGGGIPNKNMPNLFTKYYRVETEMGEGTKGTGFGLYICKSIVEMHKGEIWVESQVGQGSTFYFSIPLVTS